MMDNFAHFPEPPAEMNLCVQRTRSGLLLTGFHTISTVGHYIEKSLHLLFLVPFCFALGVSFLYYGIIRIVFFHASVQSGDGGTDLPRWAALAFVVPFIAAGALVCIFMAGLVLVQAIRMTPDRPDWALKISSDKWHSTLYSKYGNDDATDPTRELELAHILKIGVDVGGRVYAEEAADSSHEKDAANRVELTRMLPSPEAAWVQQALASLLTPAPHSL